MLPLLNLMAKWKAEFGSHNRKNIEEFLKGITVAFPENTRAVTLTLLEIILRICCKPKAALPAVQGHPEGCRDPG